MEGRKRTRWLVPANWPIFVKMLVSVVGVVALALGATTYSNVRTLEDDLRGLIGLEFETLAVAQMSHLVDILSENLTILRNIALTDQVKVGAVIANTNYGDEQVAIEAQLLAVDEQWRVASNDDQLVQSIVNPQLNRLALQLLGYKEAYPDHVEIFLTDRYGGLMASTGRTSDYYQADEGWWQAAYNDGQGAFYISQPEFDESAGFTALDMAAPILSDRGEVLGVARTTLRMEAIYELVSRVQIGETGQVTVIDSNGFIIADSHFENVGEQMPADWTVPGVFEMASYWHELVDKGDVPMLAGHASISGVDIEDQREAEAFHSLKWVLYVRQRQEEAYAPVASATRTGFVAVGVFALLAAGLAYVVARVVVAPITDLVDVARQMATGDLSVRARSRRQDETGELADAFNRMAEEVAGVVGTLEQRVAARTRELEASAATLAARGQELENALNELQKREADLEEAVRLQEEARRRQEQINRQLQAANENTRRRSMQLQATAGVSRAISQVRDPDQLLSQVTHLISRHFGFYHVGVFLIDEVGREAVLRAANSEGGQRMLARGHRLPVGGQGIVGFVTGTGQPRVTLDVGTDAVYFDNPDLPETRSEMALPLYRGDRVIGALDVQSTEPNAFDDEDVAVLQALADQVSIALENARLFSQTQAALAEAEAVQQQYLQQEWVRYVGQDSELSYEYLLSGWESLAGQSLPAGDAALAKGSTITLPAEASRQGSALAVPVKQRNQIVGVLDLQKMDEDRSWTEEEIALVETVAEQLGLALESVRLFEETQSRARREALTRQITERIRDAMNVDAMLQTAVQELGRALGAPRVYARLTTDTEGNGAADGGSPSTTTSA
jgi:GAF domain-containing protein/HAMP domain-containing protein